MKRRTWSMGIVGIALLGLVSGCNGNAFSDALPSDKQVQINLQGEDDSGQALVDDETQRAGLYDLTFGVTRGINGLAVGLLQLTRTIIELPPTERVDDDHAVWGPNEPKGLERLQFKATAERVAENEYHFVLMARPKASDDDADFREIYELHYFNSGIDLGHGTILIDRDKHAEIDPTDPDLCDSGSALISFANDGEDSMKVVDVDFSQLDRSGCGDNARMGKYHYAEAEDGAGDFIFSAIGNIHEGAEAESKPLEETMTIRSQWTAQGAGRADVIVSDGEIPADQAACQDASCEGLTSVTATQCWDENFISRYENTSPEVLQGEILPGRDSNGELNPTGDVSACPFAYADPSDNPNA